MLDNTTSNEAIVVMSLTASLFFFYGLIVLYFRYSMLREWLRVSGKVCAVTADNNNLSRRAVTRYVAYSYAIDGITYLGSRICPTDAFPIYAENTNDLKSSLILERKIEKIDVYVSPKNAKASCLKNSPNGDTYFKFLLSAVVMLCSAIWAAQHVVGLWPLVLAGVVGASAAAITEAIRYVNLRSKLG